MTPLSSERARVAGHILRAEALALSAPRPRARAKALVRALLLGELARYRRRGRFPRNTTHPGRTVPVFVDAAGTPCAVAHLLTVSGQEALVATIARERNNAYVAELADDRELLAWLDAAGISIEEAAAIQPEYCEVRGAEVCGGDFQTMVRADAVGVLEVESTSAERPYGRVVALHGDTRGVAVGAEVMGNNNAQPGDILLVPVHADSELRVYEGRTIVGKGLRLEGDVYGRSAGHPVGKADLLEMLRLPQDGCLARLRALDAWYGEVPCDDETAIGCAVSPGGALDGSAATVTLLVAIVSALAGRRRTGR